MTSLWTAFLHFLENPTHGSLAGLSPLDIYLLVSWLAWLGTVALCSPRDVDLGNPILFAMYMTYSLASGFSLCFVLPAFYADYKISLAWGTVLSAVLLAVPAFRWLREKNYQEHKANIEAIERLRREES